MQVLTSLGKQFEGEYSRAMLDYVDTGGEPALHHAYELGRKALEDGLPILEVSRFHTEVLLTLLGNLQAGDHQRAIGEATAFFSEFLSPFEMSFRGFLDTVASLKTEIAERRQAEAALEKSERYYKSLIENSLDIVTILDANGILRYQSPSGKRVLGYADSDIVGKNVFEFVHPDDVYPVLEIFSAGKRALETTASAEFRFRHKNGQWIILESIGKNLLEDPFVGGIIVNSRDVTDRRNLEDIRRKYEFIVNASKEAMLLANSRLELEAVNEAGCLFLGRNREDIIGKRIDEVQATEPLKSLLVDLIERCIDGAELKYQDWFDRPHQEKQYLEIDCYPFRGMVSRITHCVFIIRDGTQRKTHEDKLREAQQERAEDLKRYSQMAQKAQEDERHRISRELHDDICQRLSALRLQLNVLEDALATRKKIGPRRLQSLKKDVDSLITEVRTISYGLRPSTLDHFGLTTSLKMLCKEFKKVNPMEIDFETNMTPNRRYDPNIELALFRIAQEALANCIKHAESNRASLTITEKERTLAMSIVDYGKGFDFQEYSHRDASDKHFGLANIRERIEYCGGTFTLQSSVGNGTSIHITVPVSQAHENRKN